MSEEGKRGTQPIREVFTISFSTEDQPSHDVGVTDDLESPHDFEEAVRATGYGLLNYLLILAALPGAWAELFNTTTTGYILPSAECDLELTLFQKGMLNAAIYAGMILASFFWGILADVKGRRPLLLVGYLADSICNVLCSMSQNFQTIVAFKFISGCLVFCYSMLHDVVWYWIVKVSLLIELKFCRISGPFAINVSYVAEFHDTKHRSKVMLFIGLFPPLANIVLPGLAWSIIPQDWSFTLFNGAFVYNSWRIFLLASSTPAFLAFLIVLYLPESPRFLMFQGRNDEALKVFQWMYAVNTGNPPETFPVKTLCLEVQQKQMENYASRKSMSVWDKTQNGFAQIKPLFRQPFLWQFLLVTIIQFGSLLGLNTLRLWMPQIFALMENFDYENRDPSLGNPSLCEMIATTTPSNATINDDLNSTMLATCVVTTVSSRVYINSIIVAATTVIAYMIFANLVNILGNKNLLLVVFIIPAACSISLNWSPNSDITLAIFSIYIALASISTTTSMNIILELMPTSLRTTALSISLGIGRCGAMSGNILFPALLTAGCMLPFIFVGSFLIHLLFWLFPVCFVLSIFIPKPPPTLM